MDSTFTVDVGSRFCWDSGYNRKLEAQYENGMKGNAVNKFFTAYKWGCDNIFKTIKSKSEVLAKTMTFEEGGMYMKQIEECYDYYRRCEQGKKIQERKLETDNIFLQDWQKKAVDILLNQDNRKVLRVVNARGNMGKSFLVNYLENRYPGECFATDPCGRMADTFCAMEDLGNSIKFILLDVPRTSVQNFNIAIVELFKNASWTSSKYNSHRVILNSSPGVVLFSNQQLCLHGLSNDRNVTMELWADQKTGDVKYYVREHTAKEFAASIMHKGQPTFRCPRLDTWTNDDDARQANPTHLTNDRLHVDGFDQCWCLGKAGYDLCGKLAPNEVELYIAENGAFAKGHAPYAVCPPDGNGPFHHDNSESLLADESVENPATADRATSVTPEPEPLENPYTSEFNTHVFGDMSTQAHHDWQDLFYTCMNCGLENPGNQICAFA